MENSTFKWYASLRIWILYPDGIYNYRYLQSSSETGVEMEFGIYIVQCTTIYNALTQACLKLPWLPWLGFYHTLWDKINSQYWHLTHLGFINICWCRDLLPDGGKPSPQSMLTVVHNTLRNPMSWKIVSIDIDRMMCLTMLFLKRQPR